MFARQGGGFTMKKQLAMLIVVSLLFGLTVGCGRQEDEVDYDGAGKLSQSKTSLDGAEETEKKEVLIAHLPKSIGGAWYTRMYAGFERYAEGKDDVTVVQIGSSEGDAALQNAAIEDFITEAQGKKAAICMSFVSPEASEQVLKKAKEAGIIIIGNEGANARNIDYDVEAFDNQAFGADIADELAGMMEEEGQYVIMVGKLSSSTHMQWADEIQSNLNEKYPKMTLIQDPYLEGNYDQQGSYEKIMEIIKTYPEIKGFFCTSATDSAGIARAIDESGMADSTTFITLGTPDLYVEYVKSGAVDLITGWDPSMMGEVMCVIAERIMNGETITQEMDFGVFGYDKVQLTDKVVKGNAWQRIDISNIDEIISRDYK